MRKGIKKFNLLTSIFFILFLVLVVFSRLTISQVDLQEQNLEKENPIPIYLASAVFSVDDLLIVDAGLGLEFFNNTNKEDPQYLGEYNLDYYISDYINVDDQLFSIGMKYSGITLGSYTYFAVYTIKENVSLELMREYDLPFSYWEFIILENDTSMVLTVNDDRQSLSLFNCTENLVALPIQYTHEMYFYSGDVITSAFYEGGYLALETYNTTTNNRTLALFDVSNHTQIELLLSWTSDDSIFTYYHDIVKEENLMYLTTRKGRAKVLNITESKTLEELGDLETGHTSYGMRIIDNYALISNNDFLMIFNITDWENVVQLGSYQRGENQDSFDVFYVIDDLIYLSHFTSRTDNLLILLDWSDPSNPVFIRTFGFPLTGNVPFFTLAVPVVLIVFVLCLSKRRIRRNKLNEN
ncbi:MAG: hypothetical protein FK732_03770 [Asgard group archaeon]|nr:hypothetical protein [Asgard group archaeon]